MNYPSTLTFFSIALMSVTMTACVKQEPETAAQTAASEPVLWPKIESQVTDSPDLEGQVQDLLGNMTLAQKVAQIIQPEIRDISVEDMRKYGFGSYLNGGGAFPNDNKHASVKDWVDLADAMYTASMDASVDGISIPTMWGTDAVHGHNNVIGATLFPHNIGLGATRNPELIADIAKATAREVMATGIDWIFAPTVAVARDDRWGRTYESYSEDPAVTKKYASVFVQGLQGTPGQDFLGDDKVVATVKHFLGDGGTEQGDDQGNNLDTEQALFDIHAQGYVGGLNAGAQSVMASFNSWNGQKMHGSHYLLTTVLKERMGFDGFVVGDWNGHGQLPGCSNEDCPDAINAGLDVYMVPGPHWKPLYHNIIAQVESGKIPLSRLDDAVARVLRVKFRAGLFSKPSPAKRKLSGNESLIGAPEHRKVAQQAVRESLVLLKNDNNILPLDPKLNVLVVGDGADNIGKQSGGWSITWQGTGNQNSDFPGGHSIFAGLQQQIQAAGGQVTLSVSGEFTRRPDVAIAVFGEEPYAEGNGDLDNLEYQRGDKQDLRLLQKLKAEGIPVVSVFLSGRPLWVNAELNASDAFVAAWLPGSEGQAVADVLLKSSQGQIQHDFVGQLPFSWPKSPDQATVNMGDADYQPLLPYGFGLKYGEASTLDIRLPEQVAAQDAPRLTPRALFKLNVKKPWHWVAMQADKRTDMNSNTLKVEGLQVRTIDRNIQEDALRIQWYGEQSAQFGLIANFPEDLRAYGEADGSLQFDYLVQGSDFTGAISMLCEGGCSKPYSLNLKASDTWQQYQIPLRCFIENSAGFAKVLSPMMLSSGVNASLALSNVVLVPNSVEQGASHCD